MTTRGRSKTPTRGNRARSKTPIKKNGKATATPPPHAPPATPPSPRKSHGPASFAVAEEAASPSRKSTRGASPSSKLVAGRRTGTFPFSPEKDEWKGNYEFGGPIGNAAIMAFSHFVMYYFFVCIEKFQGILVHPWSAELGGESFVTVFGDHIATHACPTWWTLFLFSAFLIFEYTLAYLLPGPVTWGLPLPSESGRTMAYKCNGVYAWYVILLTFGLLHYTDVFPLWSIREDFGHYMTASIIWGDAASVAIYVAGIWRNRAIRMSGNVVYDFFMGSQLNPRLHDVVDLKLFAEIRNSWVILFVLSSSAAAAMYKETGTVTSNMWFLLTCHFLYVNACQKGEECIATTWDMYYEKFGWMLIFWNTAGVPFLYCFQALYLQTVAPTLNYSNLHITVLFACLFSCYYVWDTVNSQKNRFRMKRAGVEESVIRRRTFPQLPWGYIENPRTIKSEKGELFVDGWYRYARKMHYTVDVCMSFMWGYSCAFGSFIPYYYVCFFVPMLLHRTTRDEARCHQKYGKLWEQYLALVPYKYIPGVY